MNRIRRNPLVIEDVVDGQIVLCHTGSAELFQLSPTGALVWSACDDGTTDTIDSMVECLQGIYPNEDHGRLVADVLSFVRSLEEAGLFEVRYDSSDA